MIGPRNPNVAAQKAICTFPWRRRGQKSWDWTGLLRLLDQRWVPAVCGSTSQPLFLRIHEQRLGRGRAQFFRFLQGPGVYPRITKKTSRLTDQELRHWVDTHCSVSFVVSRRPRQL